MSVAHILIADPNQEISDNERRYLNDKYRGAYDVTTVTDSAGVIATMGRWQSAGERVALLVVDAKLDAAVAPSCLAQVGDLKIPCRVVVTSDIDNRQAALEAVFTSRANDAVLNSRPLEQEFERVVTELLDDWLIHDDPALQRVTVVGPRWSQQVHILKEFLTMSHVPFTWIDSDGPITNERRSLLRDTAGPAVLLPNGRTMLKPSVHELAAALDITQLAKRPMYDLIVIGAGPAGLGTAVHAAAEGQSTLVFERDAPGGQAGHSSRIENYFGFPGGISGGALTERGFLQALRLGAEVISPVDITQLDDLGTVKRVVTASGEEYYARTVVLANGVDYRRLDAPGADELTGSGVYYGASTAETLSFTGENVVIIGGANSAGQAAMDVSGVAANVTVVIRAASLDTGMSAYLVEQIAGRTNIHVVTNAEVAEVQGGVHVDGVVLRDRSSGTLSKIAASGIFAFIGAEARTNWLPDTVMRDAHGFVVTNNPTASTWAGVNTTFATSLPGVFSVGDVRSGAVRRVNSATGAGSQVVPDVLQYLATTRTAGEVEAPVRASIVIGDSDAEQTCRAIERAFGSRGFVLDPDNNPTTGWTLRQPELGPRGKNIAHLDLARHPDGWQIDVAVQADQLPDDRVLAQRMTDGWAAGVGVFLREHIAREASLTLPIPAPAEIT